VLLDGAEGLHEDAAFGEAFRHLWAGEVGKVTNASHVCTLPATLPRARQNEP
jgi:hypothetical protein